MGQQWGNNMLDWMHRMEQASVNFSRVARNDRLLVRLLVNKGQNVFETWSTFINATNSASATTVNDAGLCL